MQVLASPNLTALLDAAIAARTFPGAVVCWQHNARQLQLARGHFTCQNATPVTPQTIYDLASLTKLWTMAAWLIVAHEFEIAPMRRIADFLPAFGNSDKRDIQIAHLLDHSSGIECAIQSLVPDNDHNPPQVLAGAGGAHWIQQLAAAPLKTAPGRNVLYSCSNYFLLARILATIIDGNLAQFIARRLIEPLYDSGETVRTLFAPGKYLHDQIAPTEIQRAGEALCGRTHDEAARFYTENDQDFCGNAGLFADAEGVLRFARLWLHEGAHEGTQILPPHNLDHCWRNSRLENAETGARRGWCWQIDAAFYLTDNAPRGSLGHLGFTGPSLWLHPASQRVCIVLNNRVHPTRDGPNRLPLLREISREFLEF